MVENTNPPTGLPYLSFSRWLKARYGSPVRKVPLVTGLTCPNRDGTKAVSGCLFCDENSAGVAQEEVEGKSITAQLAEGIKQMEHRARTPQRYMAYLQSGTNTHGESHRLHQIYQQAGAHPLVVAVAIGTRPDCIDVTILDMIEQTLADRDVWIELGVQSSHDRSLELLGRRHTFIDTTRAINLAKARGFFVCAHLILGLPGETDEDMLMTIQAINAFGVDAVKFHPLSITKGSRLEAEHKSMDLELLTSERYVELVVKMIEHLSPKVIVQRLVGGGRPETHLAPEWAMGEAGIIKLITDALNAKGTRQGSAL
jgi:uncharacterized protein